MTMIAVRGETDSGHNSRSTEQARNAVRGPSKSSLLQIFDYCYHSFPDRKTAISKLARLRAV